MISAPTSFDRGDERKLVTILFADLVGSTALGERIDPERLRALLDSYFRAMAVIIEGWGGTVRGYIGDAIMAVFGVPVVREDDPQRAIRAALEMLDRLTALNQEFRDRHGVELQVRIGINTGEVIVPVGGPVERILVAGDPANVAARLEQAAEPGTVLVGERTYLRARDHFRFELPLILELKGKARPIRAWRVVAAAPVAAGVGRLQANLVGRDRDLATLAGLFDEVLETARPRLTLVVGPAGIGKSRLVREFVAGIRLRQPDIAMLRGRCLAAGHGTTYWPLGEMLREACQISLDDQAEVARERLRSQASEALRRIDLAEPEIQEAIPALGATAGISFPEDPFERLDPQVAADRIARAWPRFASAFAARGPALFVVEDLHWAGDPLLQLLDRLVARSTGPVLIVGTARHDIGETGWGFLSGREDVATLSLRRLTDQQSEAVIDGLLPGVELPADVEREILAKAEGNPFFLEEIVQRLMDEGAFSREKGGWQMTAAIHAIPLPDTVQALLATRIDALPPVEKRVLQEASVVGRIFWQEPIARALGEGSIETALDDLETRGLLFARPKSAIAGQPEYSFKHALVRDVAYASLSKARRARAHAEIAEWLETLAGERIAGLTEIVASHYWEAVQGEDADLAWDSEPARSEVMQRAFEAQLAAGAVKRKLFAVASAIELDQGALTLAGSGGERLRALEALGDDYDSLYHGDDAARFYQEALALARAGAAGATDHARLCRKLAWMIADRPGAFRANPDPALAEGYVAEGLAVVDDDLNRAWLLVARGASARLWRNTEPFGQGMLPDRVPIEQRIAAANEALAVGEAKGLPDLVSAAAETLGILHGIAGNYAEVLSLARRGLDRLSLAPSKLEQAEILRKLADQTIDIAAGYEEGLELARRAYDLSMDGSPHQRMHATGPILVALYELGRWQELLPVVDEHLAAFEQDPAIACQHVRDGPIIGATVRAHRGELDQARALAALVGDPLGQLESASAWQARFAVASGDPRTARSISEPKAREARAYAPQNALALLEALIALADWEAIAEFLPRARASVAGNALLEPYCDRADGLLLAQAGRLRNAQRMLRRAVKKFGGLKVPYEAARTAEMLAALVEADAARTLVLSARATYKRLGVPFAEPPATSSFQPEGA